jgi:hypothetical protein
LRDVNTICRRSWYIAAHVWKIYDFKIEVVPLSELWFNVMCDSIYRDLPCAVTNEDEAFGVVEDEDLGVVEVDEVVKVVEEELDIVVEMEENDSWDFKRIV